VVVHEVRPFQGICPGGTLPPQNKGLLDHSLTPESALALVVPEAGHAVLNPTERNVLQLNGESLNMSWGRQRAWWLWMLEAELWKP